MAVPVVKAVPAGSQVLLLEAVRALRALDSKYGGSERGSQPEHEI